MTVISSYLRLSNGWYGAASLVLGALVGSGCVDAGNVLLAAHDCPVAERDWLRPGDSIQAALDQAADGDTICLGPGRYTQRIDVPDKDLRLVGVQGWRSTTLDAERSGNVVSIAPGTTTAVIEGLTITGGFLTERDAISPIPGFVPNAATGAGVLVLDRPAELRSLRVTDNRIESAQVVGVGVASWAGNQLATTTLFDVRIDRNVAAATRRDSNAIGVGAAFIGAVGPVIRRSLFHRNTTDSEAPFDHATGGGLLYTSSADVSDVSVIDNAIAGVETASGGGVAAGFTLQFVASSVRRAYIADNSAVAPVATGGGIHGRVVVSDAVIARNHAIGKDEARGGGFSVPTFGPSVLGAAPASATRVRFVSNTVEGGVVEGGGLLVRDRIMQLTNVSLSSNSLLGETNARGAAILALGCELRLSNVTVVRNTANLPNAWSVVVGRDDSRSAVVEDTIIADNPAGGIEVAAGFQAPSFSFTHLSNAPASDLVGHPDIAGEGGNTLRSAVFEDTSDADPERWNLRLQAGSSLEDSGGSSAPDPDGSANDPGAYGGPESADWIHIDDDVFLRESIVPQ